MEYNQCLLKNDVLLLSLSIAIIKNRQQSAINIDYGFEE